MTKKQKIILASKSSRRKQLLSRILDDFKIINSNLDESKIKIDDPANTVEIYHILKQKRFLKILKMT